MPSQSGGPRSGRRHWEVRSPGTQEKIGRPAASAQGLYFACISLARPCFGQCRRAARRWRPAKERLPEGPAMSEPATVIPLPTAASAPPTQQTKDLYEVGEIPPLGHVPARMYAWAIRRDRHGPPDQSMQVEIVPTPAI